MRSIPLTSVNPIWILLSGILTLTISHLSFNIGLAAWISMVPFLLYLQLTNGWRSRMLFILALVTAWSLIVLKIISPPIPYLFVFLYSVPIMLIHLPGYLLYDRLKGNKYGILVFPAMMVLLEWVQYTFTPFGSWGAAAYTQEDNMAMVQVVSLFGMPGLGFMIYYVNAALTDLFIRRKAEVMTLGVPAVLLSILLIFGGIRYDISKAEGKETIPVAAIGTDSRIGGLPLPSFEDNVKDIRAIFQRTRNAAASGARLAVWNEAAFFLLPENESQWVDSVKMLASVNDIAIVASYVLLTNKSPLEYENKFIYVNASGEIDHTYLKHEPVPGEPAVKGTSPLEVVDLDGSKVGGAICYDYDFPYLAAKYSRLSADIVALPSSDWRGIDPLHTKMAAFRAAEQGHSIIRSTRFGLSAAITPYGEITYQMSSFDGDKVMIARVPSKGINTLYSIIGDVLVYFCMAFLFLQIALHAIHRRSNQPDVI